MTAPHVELIFNPYVLVTLGVVVVLLGGFVYFKCGRFGREWASIEDWIDDMGKRIEDRTRAG